MWCTLYESILYNCVCTDCGSTIAVYTVTMICMIEADAATIRLLSYFNGSLSVCLTATPATSST